MRMVVVAAGVLALGCAGRSEIVRDEKLLAELRSNAPEAVADLPPGAEPPADKALEARVNSILVAKELSDRTSARKACRDIGSTSLTWSMVAAGAGVVSGGSGLSTIAVPDDWKTAMGFVSLGTGVVAAVAGVAVKYWGDEYAGCIEDERAARATLSDK